MTRWIVGIVLAGTFVASAAGAAPIAAQPVPTVSPMASASPTPETTLQPQRRS